MRVGFIGLGSQGGPMARRIVDAGIGTTLWARRAGTLTAFTDGSADIAHSAESLAAVSDLVSICVVDDAGVEDVLTSENGVLAGIRPGAVVAIHSTVHPETCKRMAALTVDRGATLIDAPVSGGGGAATEGRLLVVVGGDAHDVDRVRPVFETFGDPVLHVGPLGAGQTAKLINNLLFTANLATASSALELARSLRIDPTALSELIAHGSGHSQAFAVLAGLGFTPEPMAATAGPLLRKDVNIVAGMAKDASAPLGALSAAAESALELMGYAASG